MADKITVDQVHELLAVLRTDAAVDVKVQLVTAAKSGIKQHNVPDHAVPVLFEALRTASGSQHAALVNAGFTALNHLLTRLSRQEPKFLAKEAARTLPLVVDKLGDLKEKYRALAQQALVTLYAAAPLDVERSVRNAAMAGKNPRAKEASMQWLLQMHAEQAMPFRAYVPALMELLEDADGMVRDAARATVIELFRDAPSTAKTDLKRQLKNFKVRPAIEQAIVKELLPHGAGAGVDASDSQPPRPQSRALRSAPSMPALGGGGGGGFSASVSSMAERPITPLPDAAAGRADQVEPAYVNTQRELDDLFKEMHVWFEGKETEQNWLKREESMTKLRALLAGNAADFLDAFLAHVRALLDGIIKAVVSLRTSLCKEGCSLVQDLATVAGPGIDPMVEILLQVLVKLSAGTKKISSQLANTTVDTILARATYSTRILQHVWGACQDKNVQPRTYASGWVRTVLTKERDHRERLEHSGGLELVEKCIKKGLVDPNPGVRERMRATYWYFATLWPARADLIMSGLDTTAQKLLQNDPNNPNSPKRPGTAPTAAAAGPAARPGMGFSKSTTSGPPKPSLRETMLAKKKEAAALAAARSNPHGTSNHHNLPARPGSAMAHFSPVRTVSGASTASAASASTAVSSAATKTGFGRQRGEGGAGGGLSVAPVRPTKARRPELHARPATAGPYSVRTHDHPSTEQASPPETLRSRTAITPRTLGASPKRTGPAARAGRPGHQATASDSNLVTPSRGAVAAKSAAGRAPTSTSGPSPRGSPSKPKPAATRPGGLPATATKAADGPPSVSGSPSRAARDVPAVAAVVDQSDVVVVDDVVDDDDNLLGGRAVSPPLKVYEDPFSDEPSTPKPMEASLFAPAVLEDKPVNEDAGNLARLPDESVAEAAAAAAEAAAAVTASGGEVLTPPPAPLAAVVPSDANGGLKGALFSPSLERAKQNARLLDSGIAKVQAQALDVHGFRKLQGIIREVAGAPGEDQLSSKPGGGGGGGGGSVLFTDERFDALVTGLFAYLASPVTSVAPEKAQDVKAQILATIKLLLKKWRDRFQPHVSRGLEALLAARAGYEARTHMVAGLELLADELVTLGDAAEICCVLTKAMGGSGSGSSGGAGGGGGAPTSGSSVTSAHALSLGLHMLKTLVDGRPSFAPTDGELAQLCGLAQRCLESSESGVRMDAVQLCVAVHERVGDEARFWGALRGVHDDPRSLITYYIVKRQREAKAYA